LKYDAVLEVSRRKRRPGNRRLKFRFDAMPVEIVGSGRVEGVRVRPTDAGDECDDEVLATSLVLRSIGYHGTPVSGLPFDADNGVLPNDGGRVLDAGRPMPGVYTAGWVKRGPRGVIGTNRACAHQTLTAIMEDFRRGVLVTPSAGIGALDDLLRERGVDFVDWCGWRSIDEAERKAGAEQSRPRSKLVTVGELLAASRS